MEAWGILPGFLSMQKNDFTGLLYEAVFNPHLVLQDLNVCRMKGRWGKDDSLIKATAEKTAFQTIFLQADWLWTCICRGAYYSYFLH
ncbi:hypothetical protein PAT3040_02615 [Paenibacillus agaridevorans]|uniref:Uncharacterized protein n=1 Tax=Paenibacillus agaridevorans TaxID=171404 RepID=A0A2R5ESN2_9BACL|nr:hypothetical protein PAT3040_02615 [Paenibacillus agaridevorans]